MNATLYFAMSWFIVTTTVALAQPQTVHAVQHASSVSYRLSHFFHVIEAASKDAVWQIELDTAAKEIKSVSSQVDVMTFDSGNSNRDSHAMEVVDAMTYPDVRFSSTTLIANRDSLNVTGKLTFHGVTRDIVVTAVSKWSADNVEIRGNFNVSLTDFNVDRPSFLMIPVDDTLKFSLTAMFNIK